MDEPSHLSIGEAANAAGVNVQTLHYYERRGLIRAPMRTAAGYRRYDPGVVHRVRAIKRAQSLGFTLREVQALAALRTRKGPAKDVSSMVTGKLREIDEKLRSLRVLRTALTRVVERCQCGGDLSQCDVLADLGAAPAEVSWSAAARRPSSARRNHHA